MMPSRHLHLWLHTTHATHGGGGGEAALPIAPATPRSRPGKQWQRGPNRTQTDPEDREWLAATVVTRFNSLVVEDRFKWPSYEPNPGNISANYEYITSAITDLARVSHQSSPASWPWP